MRRSDLIVVDAGGTSSKFSIYRNGEIKKKIQLPSSHILQVGPSKMVNILSSGIEKVKLGNDFEIIFALAGYGEDQEIRKRIESAIDKKFSIYNYYLTNDIELAYYSEFKRTTGILVILGTGSVAYKYKDDKFYRAGGWGYKIGDEGSGYDLSMKLIRIFSQQSDGRLPKTILYYKLKKIFGLNNDYDLINKIQNMGRTEIASLSRVLYYLYEQGDPYAINIINYLSKEVIKLIEALDDLDVSKVILFGGISSSFSNLDKLIESNLRNGLDVIIGKNNAASGALSLSKEVL